MHIKSIVLDGFKSYGKRVEVNGFDSQFNAITGLNGTGKSNILDGICFVLGITNLTHVRAASLQDLIYKSGQAGISKATVSITFDNRNKDQSPLEYQHVDEIVITRQIVMGGKNKYWINGQLAPNKKVSDLFCSIQLNVNNPHFLIMQGRVTKVLNMKPHEILSMVEEAAGTRMYESKRQAAQKTIEKKDAKLTELRDILMEEVTPKLEKLRQERQSYLEFLRIERELEHMNTLYQAWLYYATQRASEKAEEKLKAGEDKVTSVENIISENKRVIDEITNEVMVISKEAEEKTGSRLRSIEAAVKEKEVAEAKAAAVEKSSKENISTEEKKLKQLEKNLKEDQVTLDSKEKELSKVQNLFETLKENDAKDTAAFALSQKKFEAISAGMEVNEEGEAETLQEQFMNAKQEAAEASTEMKTASMELTHCKTTLKEKEKELGSNAAEYKKDQTNLQNTETEVKSLEQKLSKLNFSEDRMNELQQHKRQLVTETRSHKEKIEHFEACRPYTKFNYRDPETNFNRSRVHGIVCKLFKVKEPKYCTALETAAGGRLYNVVVDTDNTSKILLQRGQLQTRTTFIPLNKIQGSNIPNNIVKLAQDVGGKENVQPAISLITYDKKLQPAMEYIFGNVFICTDMDVARQVTFDNRIKKKCVTLDGDVTDPGGTLSGGARQKGTPVLVQVNEVIEKEVALREKEKELFKVENEIRQMLQGQEQYENMKQRLELKQHELQTVRQRIEHTVHHQQQQEVQRLKESIVNLTERLKQCEQIEARCTKKAKDLESKLKDSKGHRERVQKEAETEMKKNKAQSDKSRKEWQKREQEYETLNMEISELKKAIENAGLQITETQENLVRLKEHQDELGESLKQIRAELVEIQGELKNEKALIANTNKEIQKKVQRKEKLIAENSEHELDIKKQDHEIKKLREQFNSAKAKEHEVAKRINRMDEKNLKDASELSDKDGQDLHEKISKAQGKRDKLSRTVNTKAQSMFEHEEKQYNALLKRQQIVEGDRKKLLAVMVDLDKKKKEALQLAYDQVKKDFGSIFGTLLPGSNATLQAPQGKTILEGLEVKVSLGGVWKESLSELSGGQRSLVALSLILAMLLFKPAPLYILDEVDAALDLSHTQNIGNMLKSHFKQSQFIIVSLKDGMFNNANVLFRTKFIDGMSSVGRTVNKARVSHG